MNMYSRGLRGKRRKPMAEINVVPYIDVSLVLLVIFMITSPMLLTGVNVDLPRAESKAVEPGKDPPIVITIKAEGELLFDGGDHQKIYHDYEIPEKSCLRRPVDNKDDRRYQRRACQSQ